MTSKGIPPRMTVHTEGSNSPPQVTLVTPDLGAHKKPQTSNPKLGSILSTTNINMSSVEHAASHLSFHTTSQGLRFLSSTDKQCQRLPLTARKDQANLTSSYANATAPETSPSPQDHLRLAKVLSPPNDFSPPKFVNLPSRRRPTTDGDHPTRIRARPSCL